jgi:hypothetical protein
MLRHVAVILTFPVSVPTFKTLLTGQHPANTLTSLYQDYCHKTFELHMNMAWCTCACNDGISCPLFQTSYPGIIESKNIYAIMSKNNL